MRKWWPTLAGRNLTQPVLERDLAVGVLLVSLRLYGIKRDSAKVAVREGIEKNFR